MNTVHHSPYVICVFLNVLHSYKMDPTSAFLFLFRSVYPFRGLAFSGDLFVCFSVSFLLNGGDLLKQGVKCV